MTEQAKGNQEIIEVCNIIKELLLAKNTGYGDAAATPLNIFNDDPPIKKVEVRIEDKLKRIKNNQLNTVNEPKMKIVGDLIGYCILWLRISADGDMDKLREIILEDVLPSIDGKTLG